MIKTISTLSDFVTTSNYQLLEEKVDKMNENVDEIDEHVKWLHTEFKNYQEDHTILHIEEKETFRELIHELSYSIHRLKVAILWMVAGLICSGVAIIVICTQLIR